MQASSRSYLNCLEHMTVLQPPRHRSGSCWKKKLFISCYGAVVSRVCLKWEFSSFFRFWSSEVPSISLWVQFRLKLNSHVAWQTLYRSKSVRSISRSTIPNATQDTPVIFLKSFLSKRSQKFCPLSLRQNLVSFSICVSSWSHCDRVTFFSTGSSSCVGNSRMPVIIQQPPIIVQHIVS